MNIQEYSDEARKSVPSGVLDTEEWIQHYNRIFAELVLSEYREKVALLVEERGAEGYGTLAIAAMIRLNDEGEHDKIL